MDVRATTQLQLELFTPHVRSRGVRKSEEYKALCAWISPKHRVLNQKRSTAPKRSCNWVLRKSIGIQVQHQTQLKNKL